MRKSLPLVFTLVILLTMLTLPLTSLLAQDDPTPTPEDEAPPEGGVETSGKYLVALDFNVTRAGFGFENYGNEAGPINLTATEMRRMFGDKVCANLKGNTCTLTPAAKQMMEEANSGMGGGHCEGMAVLSLLFKYGKANPADFGASETSDLQLEGNEKLQREIAYWWATQFTVPDIQGQMQESKQTPNDVLTILEKAFQEGTRGEAYTIGFFKRDGTGGHAVTPWAIEDRGDGIFWILIYDNNFPGINRAIEIDSNANAWKYSASTKPDEPEALYEGDATTKTLQVSPNSPRLGVQPCEFCGDATSGVANIAFQAQQKYLQLWVEGDNVKLLITDDQGRKFGSEGGKLFRDIPGVKMQPILSGNLWNDNQSPIYEIPMGLKFTLTIDGSGLKKETTSDVVMIGPGYYLGLEELTLQPGQKDTLELSADGTKLSYKTAGAESPYIVLGWEDAAADYGFTIVGVDLDGGAINVALDKGAGQISVSTPGSKAGAVYGLAMEKITDSDELVFGTNDDGISIEAGATAVIEFGKWAGDKSKLPLGIDKGSDGSIDETVELEDVK